MEFSSVTLNRASMKSGEYLAVHPFGKIPGMKAADGETGIFESGALMLYVADLSGSLPTPEQRGAAASWVIWANATMWPALESSRGKGDMQALFGPVDAILGKQKWILGDDKGGRGRQQTTRKWLESAIPRRRGGPGCGSAGADRSGRGC